MYLESHALVDVESHGGCEGEVGDSTLMGERPVVGLHVEGRHR